MKKIKKSSALHLWNDHSGMIQVEDMKENSIFIILRFLLTVHRTVSLTVILSF